MWDGMLDERKKTGIPAFKVAVKVPLSDATDEELAASKSHIIRSLPFFKMAPKICILAPSGVGCTIHLESRTKEFTD